MNELLVDPATGPAVLFTALFAIALAIGAMVATWCRNRKNKRSFARGVEKLNETAAELNRLEAHYGHYRRLDKLAGGDFAKALVDLGDVTAHWLALGGAWLAAVGDDELHDICSAKLDWLNGDFKGSFDEFLADRFQALCFDNESGKNRALSPKQRAVVSGAGLDGKVALATVIKHLNEAFANEAAKAQGPDGGELADDAVNAGYAA